MEYLKEISKTIKIMLSGRMQYKIPLKDIDDYKLWDIIEEYQMELRGYLPDDVFVTLRFKNVEEDKYFIVDIFKL